MKQNLKNIPAWNADRHLNQVVKSMPPSGIRKFFDLVNEMEGAISLGVGEPDFVTPWHVREACIYSLESGDTHYTSNKGMPELREAICDQTRQRSDAELRFSRGDSDHNWCERGGRPGFSRHAKFWRRGLGA